MSPAFAVKRHHKPWLLFSGHHQESHEKDSTPTPAVRAEPAAPRVVASNPPETVEEDATPTKDHGEKIAKQAMKYKGTRYRFGGSTKRGMDCSGLVSRIYEDLKLKRVPRASSALYNSGAPVSLSELRPGDLVFFKNTYRRGISHVGVYAGHNKFVHASNRRRGVTVTPLSDPYYQLHYAGARRLY